MQKVCTKCNMNLDITEFFYNRKQLNPQTIAGYNKIKNDDKFYVTENTKQKCESAINNAQILKTWISPEFIRTYNGYDFFDKMFDVPNILAKKLIKTTIQPQIVADAFKALEEERFKEKKFISMFSYSICLNIPHF